MAIGRGKTGLEAIADAITDLAESMLMLSIVTLSNQLKTLGQSAKIPTIDDLIDKLEKLQKGASKNSNAISDAEKESGASLKKIVANYMHTTGMVGQGLSGLARGAMLPLAAATGAFAAAASGAIQEIANFVSKANPSTYFQFNRALDDLAGTLGQILTPVLEGVTVFIRTFADAMQKLRPSLEPIMLSMKAIIIEMSRLIEPLSMLLQPAFELLGSDIALQKIEGGLDPDAMLMDIVMPGMNGFELLKKIRDENKAPHSVIIMLSNRGQENDIKEAKSLGVAGYIVKANSTPSEVIARVTEMMKEHHN
jgi:CheY-like chemotaxis protein